jgi:transcriptional regulator with XRE-family HTH domain
MLNLIVGSDPLPEVALKLMQLNPYMYLRTVAGLSTQQLADLAGLDNKYVYRQERGLVNAPSGALNDALIGQMHGSFWTTVEDYLNKLVAADVSNIVWTNVTVNGFANAESAAIDGLFHRWVATWRAFVSQVVKAIPEYQFTASYRQVSPLSVVHPFLDFMDNFTILVGNPIGLSTITGSRRAKPSQQAFSRITAQHARNWQLYIGSKKPGMPPALQAALIECGLDRYYLQQLEGIVADWLKVMK